MRKYNSNTAREIPAIGDIDVRTDLLSGPQYTAFVWWIGLRNYDPINKTVTLQVMHEWPNDVTLSRNYTLDCPTQWQEDDCYLAILDLSPYTGSTLII